MLKFNNLKKCSILCVLAIIFQIISFSVFAEDSGAPVIGDAVLNQETRTVSFTVSNVTSFDSINVNQIKASNLLTGSWRSDINVSDVTVNFDSESKTASINFPKSWQLIEGYKYKFTVTVPNGESSVSKELSFIVNSTGVFDASKDFETWTGGYNGSYWQAYYRQYVGYKNMNKAGYTAMRWQNTFHSVSAGDERGRTVYDSTSDINNKQFVFERHSTGGLDNGLDPYVGSSLMCTGTGTAVGSVARAFTAPYSGTISISQNNTMTTSAEAKNQIWGSEGEHAVCVEIKDSKDKVVWPADGNPIKLNKNSSTYAFEPVEMEVKKGDVLYFTAYNEDWNDAWNCFVHWNPVVTYTDVASSVTFKNGSTELKTASALLGAESAKAEVSVINYSDEKISATPIIAFYKEDGTLAGVKMGTALENETKKSASCTVDLGNLKNLNAKSCKVMLWDMTSGKISPVSGAVKELSK